MEENSTNQYFIPQAISFDVLTKTLGYCFSLQNRNQDIILTSLLEIDIAAEYIVKNAIKMLEYVKILDKEEDSSAYSLSENSMKLAEGLASGTDVKKELKYVIENSFLQKILDSIVNNDKLTRDQLISNIMMRSFSPTSKNFQPYKTTINCILDLLNLTGELSEDVFSRLRGTVEKNTVKSIASKSIKSKPSKQKSIAPSESYDGKYGIIITSLSRLELSSIQNITFARSILDSIEEELSKSIVTD